MGRVIRISAVVMGVLLVGMMGGLGVLWARDESLSTMLVLINSNRGEYYALLEPQSGKIIRITPFYYRITEIETSPDGRWLYFVETNETEAFHYAVSLNGRLRRVALGAHPPADEFLMSGSNFRLTALSPDFQWLLFSDDTTQDLIAANLFTGERRNLTTELPNNFHYFITPSQIAFDEEWVMFSGWDDNRNIITHYRVRLDGTELEHIGDIDGIFISYEKPEKSGWYIGFDHYSQYRVRKNLQEHFVIDPGRLMTEVKFKYWLTDKIVLLEGEDWELDCNTIFAVQITDGQILWMADYVVEHWYIRDGGMLFFRRFDYTLAKSVMETISPDGSNRRVVPIAGNDMMGDMPSMSLFDWRPNADWWFYLFHNDKLGRFELHRLSADWKTDETIWIDENHLSFQRREDNHLIFSTDERYPYRRITALYQLNSDTLEVKRITQLLRPTLIVDANGPSIDRDFQPIPLMVIGGGLMMGTLLWRRVHFRELHH